MHNPNISSTFAPANTGIAQLVEHRSPKPGVGSSSLSSRAKVAAMNQLQLFLCQSGRPQHEIPTHHPRKHLACIGRNRNIPSLAPNHSLPALVRHPLRAELRKTLSMAHPPEIPGDLHPQLPRASRHPSAGKNHLHRHGVGYSNLLRHNR